MCVFAGTCRQGGLLRQGGGGVCVEHFISAWLSKRKFNDFSSGSVSQPFFFFYTGSFVKVQPPIFFNSTGASSQM